MASTTFTGTNQARRAGWLRRQKTQQAIFALIILVPTLLSFLLFWVYPFLGGIWGGFTLWKAFDPHKPFVGLRHYQGLMNDPIFITALKNTFFYALMYLPAGIALALILALAIEATGPARARRLPHGLLSARSDVHHRHCPDLELAISTLPRALQSDP